MDLAPDFDEFIGSLIAQEVEFLSAEGPAEAGPHRNIAAGSRPVEKPIHPAAEKLSDQSCAPASGEHHRWVRLQADQLSVGSGFSRTY